MKTGKILAGLSVLTLAAAPAISSAAEAEFLRGASPVAEAEQMAGTSMLVFVGFLAALAAVVVIASDDDEPESP